MEEWNYISTFYFLVKNSRKYVNLCEKVAFIALKDTKGPEIWLEASTERSKSNPGRSLGIYRAYSDCCLEDSTSQRAKHPRQSYKSVFVSPLSFFRTRIYRIDTDFGWLRIKYQ